MSDGEFNTENQGISSELMDMKSSAPTMKLLCPICPTPEHFDYGIQREILVFRVKKYSPELKDCLLAFQVHVLNDHLSLFLFFNAR